MEPLRLAGNAKYFKLNGKMYRPSKPCARCKEVNCDSCGNLFITINQVPNGQLEIEQVSFVNFMYALSISKPSVDPRDLHKFKEWTLQFGQDG